MSKTEINLSTVDINGEKYVRAADVSEAAGPPTDYRIVIADRGWVFVGATTQDSDGSINIANARCIRIWGTDADKPGLGYLALNGPTSKTRLEPSGVVRVPSHAVIATFDTEAFKWA